MKVRDNFDFTRPRTDRRTERRAVVDYNAMIVLDGKAPIPCAVTDYSPNGARLRLERAEDLPDHFGLYIPKTGRSHAAQVRNRHDLSIGVEFVSPHANDAR